MFLREATCQKINWEDSSKDIFIKVYGLQAYNILF